MIAKSILRKICTWSCLKLSMAAASTLSQALATFARRVGVADLGPLRAGEVRSAGRTGHWTALPR